MTVILYMGKASEFLGIARETVDLPDSIATSQELRHWLDSRADKSGAFLDPTIRLCLNQALKKEPCSISKDDEIAFLPPVGGG